MGNVAYQSTSLEDMTEEIVETPVVETVEVEAEVAEESAE